jgi:hypothetical protein
MFIVARWSERFARERWKALVLEDQARTKGKVEDDQSTGGPTSKQSTTDGKKEEESAPPQPQT